MVIIRKNAFDPNNPKMPPPPPKKSRKLPGAKPTTRQRASSAAQASKNAEEGKPKKPVGRPRGSTNAAKQRKNKSLGPTPATEDADTTMNDSPITGVPICSEGGNGQDDIMNPDSLDMRESIAGHGASMYPPADSYSPMAGSLGSYSSMHGSPGSYNSMAESPGSYNSMAASPGPYNTMSGSAGSFGSMPELAAGYSNYNSHAFPMDPSLVAPMLNHSHSQLPQYGYTGAQTEHAQNGGAAEYQQQFHAAQLAPIPFTTRFRVQVPGYSLAPGHHNTQPDIASLFGSPIHNEAGVPYQSYQLGSGYGAQWNTVQSNESERPPARHGVRPANSHSFPVADLSHRYEHQPSQHQAKQTYFTDDEALAYWASPVSKSRLDADLNHHAQHSSMQHNSTPQHPTQGQESYLKFSSAAESVLHTNLSSHQQSPMEDQQTHHQSASIDEGMAIDEGLAIDEGMAAVDAMPISTFECDEEMEYKNQNTDDWVNETVEQVVKDSPLGRINSMFESSFPPDPANITLSLVNLLSDEIFIDENFPLPNHDSTVISNAKILHESLKLMPGVVADSVHILNFMRAIYPLYDSEESQPGMMCNPSHPMEDHRPWLREVCDCADKIHESWCRKIKRWTEAYGNSGADCDAAKSASENLRGFSGKLNHVRKIVVVLNNAVCRWDFGSLVQSQIYVAQLGGAFKMFGIEPDLLQQLNGIASAQMPSEAGSGQLAGDKNPFAVENSQIDIPKDQSKISEAHNMPGGVHYHELHGKPNDGASAGFKDTSVQPSEVQAFAKRLNL